MLTGVSAFLLAEPVARDFIPRMETQAAEAIEAAGGTGVTARFASASGTPSRHPVLRGGEALDTATFERIYDVNVIGAFQMVRACLPQLKAGGGSIVNVSSIAGALGIGSSVAYIASKGALNALTLHLARTLAPEVRVNAVCPGLITTRWFVDGVGQDNADQIQAQYEKTVPLQTSCTAEDVAEAIVWLVDGARTTTGELLMLDGGMHLGRTAPRP